MSSLRRWLEIARFSLARSAFVLLSLIFHFSPSCAFSFSLSLFPSFSLSNAEWDSAKFYNLNHYLNHLIVYKPGAIKYFLSKRKYWLSLIGILLNTYRLNDYFCSLDVNILVIIQLLDNLIWFDIVLLESAQLCFFIELVIVTKCFEIYFCMCMHAYVCVYACI